MMSNRDGVQDADRNGDGIDQLIMVLKRCIMLDISTATVGEVLSFDPATQLAEVLVHICKARATPSDQDIPLPPVKVPNVPVAFMSSGDSFMTIPILPGCLGQLVINDRSIDEWLDKGVPVVPGSPETHNVKDAVFYPGVRPKTRALPPVDQQNAVIEAPGINLGYGAVLGVARLHDPIEASPAMYAQMAVIETAINALAPGTFIPGVNDFATLAGQNMGRIKTASTVSKSL